MASRQRVSRVLLALLAGLGIGVIAGVSGSTRTIAVLHAIAPLGALWINAVRMTVVPLVVALLFTSIVGSERSSAIGRQAMIAVVTFAGILLMSVVVAWAIAPSLMGDLHVTPETSASLRMTVNTTASAMRTQIDQMPGVREWLIGLVPSNAIKAAADGAMLPLILFTSLFAFGARQIAPDGRAALAAFFSSIAEVMTVIVEWTIVVAPIGVFALIVGPASESGAAMAGAIGYYIIAISLLLALFALLLYPIAHVCGVNARAFARGVLPAQAVALASGSSLASLPALMAGANELSVPRQISGFILPLGVGVFKAAAPVTWTMGALFVAKMYGVPLSSGAVLWIALTAAAASFSIPGVPQASFLVMSGVLASMGVPAEGVALLIAADTIPDLMGTMANVTGDLVATIVVARATSDTEMLAVDPDPVSIAGRSTTD